MIQSRIVILFYLSIIGFILGLILESNVLVTELGATDTLHTLTSTQVGIFTYDVLAVDLSGNESDPSPSVQIERQDTTPPDPPTGTYLSQQAAVMQSGEWRQIHSLGDCFFRMAPECQDASALQYLTNASYDQNNIIASVMSAHGGGMELILYDIAKDQWSTGNPIPYACDTNCTTHGYDHTSFDHSTGILYYTDKLEGEIYTYVMGSSSWSKLPSINDYSTKFKAFDYFPPRGKFLIGGDGKLYEYDQNTHSAAQFATVASGNHSLMDYSYAEQVMYYAPGKETSSGTKKLYKIDANLDVNLMADAPIFMRTQTSGKGAVFTASPDGGVIIIDAVNKY